MRDASFPEASRCFVMLSGLSQFIYRFCMVSYYLFQHTYTGTQCIHFFGLRKPVKDALMTFCK
nr:MAG TPA: hypothetical protein [Caudoviricetes sp.]